MSEGSSPERATTRTWGRRALDLFRSLLPVAPTKTTPPLPPEPDPDELLQEALWMWHFDYGAVNPKEWIREQILAAHPSVAEMLAIDQGHGAYETWGSTAIIRLHDGRFVLTHVNEENGWITFFETPLDCAVAALRHSHDEELCRVFEPVVAGPFDRSLDGWIDVAADWWDEQGEDFVASELRQVAESRRYRKATEGMTMEERLAYRESLP